MEEKKQGLRYEEVLDVKHGEIIDMNETMPDKKEYMGQSNAFPLFSHWKKFAFLSLFLLAAVTAFHLILTNFETQHSYLSDKKIPPF